MGYIPAVENQCPPALFRCHRCALHPVPAAVCRQWQDETTLINQVAADMCKMQVSLERPKPDNGVFGDGDMEQVTQHAWRLLNATSFVPGEIYSGVRFEKEGEDNGLNLPFVIIKQSACPQPAQV